MGHPLPAACNDYFTMTVFSPFSISIGMVRLLSAAATVLTRISVRETNSKGISAGFTPSRIFFASRMPQMLAGFCSVERADEIARDFRPRLAGKTAELELERAIEKVRNCGRLKAARRTEISAEMARIR